MRLKKYYSWCVDCGKPISFYSTRCCKCSGKRKKELSKQKIKNRIICNLVAQHKFSLSEIGEAFGISRQAVWEKNQKYEEK